MTEIQIKPLVNVKKEGYIARSFEIPTNISKSISY